MTNNNAGIEDAVTAHMVRGPVRRTYRALVEVTVDAPPDDEYTSHDFAEALMDLDIPGLVPHDVVMYQTTSKEN